MGSVITALRGTPTKSFCDVLLVFHASPQASFALICLTCFVRSCCQVTAVTMSRKTRPRPILRWPCLVAPYSLMSSFGMPTIQSKAIHMLALMPHSSEISLSLDSPVCFNVEFCRSTLPGSCCAPFLPLAKKFLVEISCDLASISSELALAAKEA